MRNPHLVIILGVLAGISLVRAGQRPFEAESADLLAEGAVEVEAGLRASGSARRDLFPARQGDDLRIPVLGLRTGLGAWAELRVEGDLLRRFAPDDGGTVDGPGDWSIATKLRLGRPTRACGWAAWFGAKIPVASDNEGLGTNLTDLDARVLLRLAAGRGTVDLNAGVVILGAPFRERAQVDLATYAAGYRRDIASGLEVGAELSGREGGDFFGTLGSLRAGLRWQRRAWRLDGSLAAGLTDAAASSELRLGVTFRFQRGGS